MQTSTVFDGENGSPTVIDAAMNIFLTHAAENNLELASIVFDGAYLQSQLPESIYLRPPHGFTSLRPNAKNQFLRLRKSLYGLKRVFKYLKGTINFKLEFKKSNGNSAHTVWGYADASFGEDPEISKSHGGVALFVGGNLVCHYSQLQPGVTTSTF